MHTSLFLMIAMAFAMPMPVDSSEGEYLVGRGIADATGPVEGVGMMGYGKIGQKSAGIHLRLFSRAFIFSNRDGSKPFVFVNVDICMISQLIKMEVLQELHRLFGNIYTDENVLLSATHTHSGPGAYHQYVLYEITTLGLYEPSLRAVVTGIVYSIKKAHQNLQPGNIFMNSGKLYDSNINRSPTAYDNNPEEEKKKYEGNTDTLMVLLRIENDKGENLGVINWFAVHPTSINNSNHLISSDNKGYASILFESKVNQDKFPGEGEFVSIFANSNLGDVSPNTKGARCTDTGEECDIFSSTCGGKVELCHASGPGVDMFDSARIIASNQFHKAFELYESASSKLSGPLDFRYRYVDMTSVPIMENGKVVAHTAKPAMGYSFAAGTTDGPGSFDFKQGDTKGNIFWNIVRNAIKKPSRELIESQAPKPILLPTGEMNVPYKWQPDIVDFHLLRIGQLIVIGVPGEFTTMSGRRMREAVRNTLLSKGFSNDTTVVINGLSNSYCSYITTPEEYAVQRYEGASTIYGPHTLTAMINKVEEMAIAMAESKAIPKGISPPNLKNRQISFVTEVIYDAAPIGYSIGDVKENVKKSYSPGDIVQVIFYAGNPRNSDQLNHCYLQVEQLQSDSTWKIIAKDSCFETKFIWTRTNSLEGHSEVTGIWEIPTGQQHATYRIVHKGHKKSIFGKVSPYSGKSSHFKVKSNYTTKRLSGFT